jgi:outer membrane autotransporter protein
LASLTLTPYAAAQAQAFEAPSYAESASGGGPGFAMNYASQSATDTRFELGAWADKTFAAPDGNALKMFGRLAWAHDWQSSPAKGDVPEPAGGELRGQRGQARGRPGPNHRRRRMAFR